MKEKKNLIIGVKIMVCHCIKIVIVLSIQLYGLYEGGSGKELIFIIGS